MSTGSKFFTGGFFFGIFLCLAWTVYHVSLLDVGTSQDPSNIRHIDDSREF